MRYHPLKQHNSASSR